MSDIDIFVISVKPSSHQITSELELHPTMALYHFKKDFAQNYSHSFNQNNNSQNQAYKKNEMFGNPFSSSSQAGRCFNCSQRKDNVFMSGVNLGDVLKKTIDDEMRNIVYEKGQSWMRKGGS